MRVEPATGETVTVGIRERGRSQEALDRVTVESTVEDGVNTVAAVSENQLSNVSVRLVFGVPEGLTLESARTGNGDVTADGIVDDATARGTTGIADRSGDRNRVTGRLGDGGPRLTLSSGNGDVRLYR